MLRCGVVSARAVSLPSVVLARKDTSSIKPKLSVWLAMSTIRIVLHVPEKSALSVKIAIINYSETVSRIISVFELQ